MRVIAVHTGPVAARYAYFTDGRPRRSLPFNAVRLGLSEAETRIGDTPHEWVLSFAAEADIHAALNGPPTPEAVQRFTAAVMDLVEERFLRRAVAWYAAFHQDTPHPHIHIVYQPPKGVSPLPNRLFVGYQGLPSDMARLVEEVSRRPITLHPATNCYWRVGDAAHPFKPTQANLPPPITILICDDEGRIVAEKNAGNNTDDNGGWGLPPDAAGDSPTAPLVAALNATSEPPQAVLIATDDPTWQTALRDHKENWFPTRDPDRWLTYAKTRSPLLLNQIPEQLRDRPAWNVWIRKLHGGEGEKRPFDVKHRAGAATNNPAHWHDYLTAMKFFLTNRQVTAYYQEAKGHLPALVGGLSFLLRPTDDLVLIDLDHCRDPRTNDVSEEARLIMEHLPGYWEVSASGEGFHGLFTCDRFEWTRAKGVGEHHWIEVYSGRNAKAVALTGLRVAGADAVVGPLSPTGADWLRERFYQESPRSTAHITYARQLVPDEEIVKRLLRSRVGETYRKLAAGENIIPGANGGWSENDLKMISMIAFYSQNPDQIERIFKSTERYQIRREKWEQKIKQTTYGRLTIERAVKGLKSRYAWENAVPGGKHLKPTPQEQAARIAQALVVERKPQVARTLLEQAAADRNLPTVLEHFIGAAERKLTQAGAAAQQDTAPNVFQNLPAAAEPQSEEIPQVVAGLAPVAVPDDLDRLATEWRAVEARWGQSPPKLNRLAVAGRIKAESAMAARTAGAVNPYLEEYLRQTPHAARRSLWDARQAMLRDNYLPEKVFADWLADADWTREYIPFVADADGRVQLARYISDVSAFQQRRRVTGYVLVAALAREPEPAVAGDLARRAPTGRRPEDFFYIHQDVLNIGEALQALPHLPAAEKTIREKFSAGLGRILRLCAAVEQDPNWTRRCSAVLNEQQERLDPHRRQEIFRRLLQSPNRTASAADHAAATPPDPTPTKAPLSARAVSPDAVVCGALENPVYWPALHAVGLVYGADLERKLTPSAQRRIEKTARCLPMLAPYAEYPPRRSPLWRWTASELSAWHTDDEPPPDDRHAWWDWNDVVETMRRRPPAKPAAAARAALTAMERYLAERTAAYETHLFRNAAWRRFQSCVTALRRHLPGAQNPDWRDTPWALIWSMAEGCAQAMVCERLPMMAFVNQEATAVLETLRALDREERDENAEADLGESLMRLIRHPHNRRAIENICDYYDFLTQLHALERNLIRRLLQSPTPTADENIRRLCRLTPVSKQITAKLTERLDDPVVQTSLTVMETAWREHQVAEQCPQAAHLHYLYAAVRDDAPPHPWTTFYYTVRQIHHRLTETPNTGQTTSKSGFELELDI